MKIYLIRHGQTTGDVEERYGGDYDDHLTQFGQKQAEHLAGRLQNAGLEVLYTSSLARAQETARVVAEQANCAVVEKPEFRERNFYGILTGMLKSEAKEKYPELVELLKHFSSTLPGGEEYGAFRERVLGGLHELAALPYGTVGIITHGGPMRLIFREILKRESEPGDCSYAVLETLPPNGFRLVDSHGIEFSS